jgi:CyaY protein
MSRATKLGFDFQDIRRILMSTAPASSALSDLQYQEETSGLLARIESTTDRWLEDDVVDIDTQRTGGLLELGFPDGSKIIVNTQPPLHEVWLATRAGGYHYRWLDGAWRDTRDGSEFLAVLSRNASAQAGKSLSF